MGGFPETILNCLCLNMVSLFLFSAFKPGLFADSLRPLNSDYQKKEKDATIVEKDLPADHLTATYWG